MLLPHANSSFAGCSLAHSNSIKHSIVQVRRLAADERWAGRLELRKRKDHFVFTVESAGALPPAALFTRAVDVLADKADRLLQRL